MNKFKIGEQVLYRDRVAKVSHVTTLETERAFTVTYGIRLYPGGNRVEGVVESSLSAIPEDFWQEGKTYEWVGEEQYKSLTDGSLLLFKIPNKPVSSLFVGTLGGVKVFIEPDGVELSARQMATLTRGVSGGCRVMLQYLAFREDSNE